MTTYPYLTARSDYGEVALNGIAESSDGAEAQAGVTGLGLPPFEPSFATGIGDGAVFTGRRSASRNIDIPTAFTAATREDLQDALRRAATILTGDNLHIVWHESPSSSLSLRAALVGGGDYVYGDETEGTYWANTTFSFQTEDAHWESGATTEVRPTLENPGSAPTRPVYRVEGPANSFTLNVNGETLDYRSPVARGSFVEIDTNTGTVRDQSGASVYRNLGPSPAFPHLRPGLIPGSLAHTSYVSPGPTDIRQYVQNPKQIPTGTALPSAWGQGVQGLTTGGTPAARATFDMENIDPIVGAYVDHRRMGIRAQGYTDIISTEAEPEYVTVTAYNPTGVTRTVNVTYEMRWSESRFHGASPWIEMTSQQNPNATQSWGIVQWPNTREVPYTIYNVTLQPGWSTFMIFAGFGGLLGGMNPTSNPMKVFTFSVVDATAPALIFDGDTQFEDYIATWEEARANSTTRLVPKVDTNSPQLTVRYKPREWLVI